MVLKVGGDELISIQEGWGRIKKRPPGINPGEFYILFFY